MFLIGFAIGIVISLILFIIYLIIENTILKRDLLDAVEELGTREQTNLTSRNLIGFIKPATSKQQQVNKNKKHTTNQ